MFRKNLYDQYWLILRIRNQRNLFGANVLHRRNRTDDDRSVNPLRMPHLIPQSFLDHPSPELSGSCSFRRYEFLITKYCFRSNDMYFVGRRKRRNET